MGVPAMVAVFAVAIQEVPANGVGVGSVIGSLLILIGILLILIHEFVSKKSAYFVEVVEGQGSAGDAIAALETGGRLTA